MRDILFEAKRVDIGEWVYGCVWINRTLLRQTAHITDEKGDIHDVVSNTLCQYTGLEDKNGVKIFEGDLLKGLFYGFPCPENDYEFRVYWDDKTCGFQANYFEQKKYEVIGNIHDKEN